MMDISTKVYTHVIITWSKVHHKITAEQDMKLQKMSLDDEFKIDGCSLKVKSIAEVLTIQKYYETYPENKPYNYGQPYTEISKLPPLGYGGIADQAQKTSPSKWRSALEKSLKKFPDGSKGKEFLETLVAQLDRPKEGYEAKYKKWEEAKAAGVI